MCIGCHVCAYLTLLRKGYFNLNFYFKMIILTKRKRAVQLSFANEVITAHVILANINKLLLPSDT